MAFAKIQILNYCCYGLEIVGNYAYTNSGHTCFLIHILTPQHFSRGSLWLKFLHYEVFNVHGPFGPHSLAASFLIIPHLQFIVNNFFHFFKCFFQLFNAVLGIIFGGVFPPACCLATALVIYQIYLPMSTLLLNFFHFLFRLFFLSL